MEAKRKKPKTKRAVEGENRQDKFVRLAKSRGEKLKNYFAVLHNLVEGYTYQIDTNLAKELLSSFELEFSSLSAAWKAAIEKAEKKLLKEASKRADSPIEAGSSLKLDSITSNE